ncbi:MAG: ATP-binding cassette domain-containing protein [Acidimicrobiia bacterium]|nr:ATP-binding cassette domain-containing protein [Acidimicrobiia bacterium]
MTLLEAHDVGFVIEGATLLDGVDLDVAAGELVAVIGPNGAGKSTLISVLAGDLAPTSGSVALAGTPIGDLDLAELAAVRAVLSQHRVTGIPFTVADVVAMGAHRSGNLDDLSGVLDAFELAAIGRRTVASLSGGEHTRVELARVVMQGAPLLLLDEPLAALDVAHEERVLHHLRSMLSPRCGVLAVFHDLSAAATYADRFILLSGGEVIARGEPSDVLDDALLSEAYGYAMRVHRIANRTVVLPAE